MYQNHFSNTNLFPNYLTIEPPNFGIASKVAQWHATMVDEFSTLKKRAYGI